MPRIGGLWVVFLYGGGEMLFCELAGEDKYLLTDSDQQKIINMIREACPEDRDTLIRIIECLAEDVP